MRSLTFLLLAAVASPIAAQRDKVPADMKVVKDVVYTMRFDKASALYGEFGRFYVGYLTDIGAALDALTP